MQEQELISELGEVRRPNAKDLIRPAAECNTWRAAAFGGRRRADKSRLNGTAVLLTAGAMGILTRVGGVEAGNGTSAGIEMRRDVGAKGSENGEGGAEPSPKARRKAVTGEPWADGGKPSRAGRAGQEAGQANRRQVAGGSHGGRPQVGAARARIRREPLPQAGHRAEGVVLALALDGSGVVGGRRAVATARSWRQRASFS